MAERPTGTPCWADIAVPDVERAKQFYGAMLGWDCRTDPRPRRAATPCAIVDDVSPRRSRRCGTRARGRAGACTSPRTAPTRPRRRSPANGGQVVAAPMDVFDAGRMALAIDPAGADVRRLAEGHPPRHRDGVPARRDQLGRAAWPATPTPRPRSTAPCSASTPSRSRACDGYRTWQQDGVTRGGLIAARRDAVRRDGLALARPRRRSPMPTPRAGRPTSSAAASRCRRSTSRASGARRSSATHSTSGSGSSSRAAGLTGTGARRSTSSPASASTAGIRRAASRPFSRASSGSSSHATSSGFRRCALSRCGP